MLFVSVVEVVVAVEVVAAVEEEVSKKHNFDNKEVASKSLALFFLSLGVAVNLGELGDVDAFQTEDNAVSGEGSVILMGCEVDLRRLPRRTSEVLSSSSESSSSSSSSEDMASEE